MDDRPASGARLARDRSSRLGRNPVYAVVTSQANEPRKTEGPTNGRALEASACQQQIADFVGGA